MSLTLSWEQSAVSRASDGGDLIDSTTTEITIDLVVDYERTVSGVQSVRPIERGAPTADHWRRELESVTIQCAHTDSPPNTSTEIQLASVETPSGADSMMGELIDGGAVSRIQSLQDDMQSLIHAGHLVTVTGLDRVLTDWRVLSMTTPRAAGQAGLMMFSLQLQEVLRATIATTDAPAPRVERGRPKKDRGKAAGTEAPAPDLSGTTSRISWLASIRDSAAPYRGER